MNIHAHGDGLRRRDEILRIVGEMSVHSQDELLALLKKRGFKVTQPTLSRDLRELGVAKSPNGYVTRDAFAGGATGYSGADLTAILARHHEVELVALFSSSSTSRGPVTPTLPQFIAEPFTMDALMAAQPEIVFLCTPNEVSANLAPQLLDHGMKVIDRSGAFRLEEPSMYPTWYGFDHERPNTLGEAVYGLTEYCNCELKTARLLANPGCYWASILLALRPLTFAIDRDSSSTCGC